MKEEVIENERDRQEGETKDVPSFPERGHVHTTDLPLVGEVGMKVITTNLIAFGLLFLVQGLVSI